MKTISITKNWIEGDCPEVHKNIHEKNVNITIWNRAIHEFEEEINTLLNADIHLNLSGNKEIILSKMKEVISVDKFPIIFKDIEYLLSLFKEVTNASSFRFLLGTVQTNMCRKFHADANDLRLLCTYEGLGTLWLTDDNINKEALKNRAGNDMIVVDESKIKEAETGSVIILKGTKYPENNENAVVHKSPMIEHHIEKRLLFRIDTNQFLK
ncbi:DUF1826 domain-containing protein [Tenacibaculum sp. M341]|uniref:DUF1826 domain-containing protein n=1 Tax=Tenacibaculum sp. M341 TaxID=2530339 RepID=UPI00104AF61C|nr:DUF1826 domain-containing protein [Tenacibaculum sp. M341]TCI94145.1 DUF1826 domain-containing protein [Tenacibaculum sp. M341]